MRTELPTHTLAVGKVQVLPAQGLPTQAPLLHPLAQVTETVAYEQVPWLHVPALE